MKQIAPIVGISKIIASYDALICGFNGVISRGNSLSQEALNALKNVAKSGKEIVILSNTPLRVKQVARLFFEADFELKNIKAIVTAGEIMHYKLKAQNSELKYYYNIGGSTDEGIFYGLNYQKVSNINKADFIFIADIDPNKQNTDDYLITLQEALSLNLPLFCTGTDVAEQIGDEIYPASAAIAEQYAALGGRIVAVGKPDPNILNYTKEALSPKVEKILFIGDSFMTDMKSADLFGADMLLISKGVHKDFLKEGYIPDVQKARELAFNFNVYPDYVISELRY